MPVILYAISAGPLTMEASRRALRSALNVSPPPVIAVWDRARRAGRHFLPDVDGLPVAVLAQGLSAQEHRLGLSCEAMIHVAMIHLMLNRLQPADNEAEFHYRKTA